MSAAPPAPTVPSRIAEISRRSGRIAVRGWRRLLGRPRGSEAKSFLPLLVQVLAGFSKHDGQVVETEVDSALGFLRNDYPETVYSELTRQFRDALGQNQDLSEMAERLAKELHPERKVMLGIQLYDIIARAGKQQAQMDTFQTFTEKLGTAAETQHIVHQLNLSGSGDAAPAVSADSPLEILSFGRDANADVMLKGLYDNDRLLAFRYHNLLLLKNNSRNPVFVRGRPLAPGAFCRIYAGQRVILDEQVLTFQDLSYYFNAKKNIAVTQVYLELNDDDEVQVARARSRDSILEVRFGLKVQVRALKNMDALFNNVALRQGTLLNGNLEDRIVFHNDAELVLSDLRRRARALGGRFQLKSYKSVYHVSNQTQRLEVDDILLSPGTSGAVLLKILCDYENRVGQLEVIEADRDITVGDRTVPVGGSCDLKDGDIIRIDAGQGLRCDFSERIIEEERNIVSTIELRDLTCHFGDKAKALDGITFTLNRGDIVCVMGGSGSGKSTLLRAIAGRLPPSNGQVLLNGQSLYANLDDFKRFIAYIPQDDAFDDHLTVEENLRYAASIRSPHLSQRDRERRVDSRLIELGLAERRDIIVGSAEKKTLSGGERKRLNIGLDMISSADVFLFDEPTSGLSSKDSEHVIEIIRGLAHNKIVLVVIHQPSQRLFQMFNKAVLLDRGGKMVFHGSPSQMLDYFSEAAEQEKGVSPEIVAAEARRPEFAFDIIETPLHDLSGDEILEEATNGQLIPARRFSPDFWRDRYETHRLYQDMRQISLKQQSAATPPTQTEPAKKPAAPPLTKFRAREEWLQFTTLLRRAFLSKLRNIASLFVTLLAPPALAFVVGWALYFTDKKDVPDDAYVFSHAFHIPTYIFISLLVALFLALMNSVEDIIRDRVILQRERNLDVSIGYYVLAKFLTLCVFSAFQCALFVFVGNWILEVRGMFTIYFLWTFLTAVSGISLGLLVSAVVPNSKTAAMLVPLILIPQLIFGGALIKYEEMNRDPDLLYSFNRIFDGRKSRDDAETEKKLRVPFISRLVATHYSYESLVVAQAKLNPLTVRQTKLDEMIRALAKQPDMPLAQNDRLSDLKETLAQLSGLEAGSAREIDRRLGRIDEIIGGSTPSLRDFRTKVSNVSADQLYNNTKINDLVSKAESEQNDYRRAYRLNVFFSPEKHHMYWFADKDLGWTTSVYIRNALILLGTSGVMLLILGFILRRQLNRTAT